MKEENNKNFPEKVVTRFAPSPTGLLHIGAYRAMVFNYLFSRQNKGRLILRIEDTDKERSKKEYEENILESIEWLSLEYDEIYKQSERGEVYKKNLQKIIDEGKAYISEESEGERKKVVRFKNPNKVVSVNDLIRGEIKFDTTELGDFVLAKSLDEPLYHLAVVVDDFDMGVTHVIRGDDHISNTPRQILIQQALGAPLPVYAHLPIILAQDKSKLSKRHGAKAITKYRDEGFLPQALINYMALLGWNPGGEEEIFSVPELVEKFDLKKVQKSGAVFDENKMRWVNKEHIKRLPEKLKKEKIKETLSKTERFKSKNWKIDDKKMGDISEVFLGYVEIFSDLSKMVEEGDFDYFFEEPEYEADSLVWKKEPDKKSAYGYLCDIILKLEVLSSDDFSAENVKGEIWDYATERGRGNVLWPMRFALTGKDKSPDPFTVASILGKNETLKRLKKASEKLK